MTPQEVFDKVVSHLRKQGCRSETDKKNVAGNISCLYRGPNGTKCAAGCLIDDEDFDPEMDSGYPVSDLFAKWPVVADKIGRDNQDLLTTLQNIHDEDMLVEWENGFKYCANKFGLIYTPPELPAESFRCFSRH